MMNNFAPRGARLGDNLVFGTAGPTVTPSRDGESSDPVGLTTGWEAVADLLAGHVPASVHGELGQAACEF